MACIRLAVTALAVLAQVYGESPAVKISVTDPGALPVANARVTVRSTFGGTPIERSTDEHGGVIVTPPSAGRYLVLIAVEDSPRNRGTSIGKTKPPRWRFASRYRVCKSKSRSPPVRGSKSCSRIHRSMWKPSRGRR